MSTISHMLDIIFGIVLVSILPTVCALNCTVLLFRRNKACEKIPHGDKILITLILICVFIFYAALIRIFCAVIHAPAISIFLCYLFILAASITMICFSPGIRFRKAVMHFGILNAILLIDASSYVFRRAGWIFLPGLIMIAFLLVLSVIPFDYIQSKKQPTRSKAQSTQPKQQTEKAPTLHCGKPQESQQDYQPKHQAEKAPTLHCGKPQEPEKDPKISGSAQISPESIVTFLVAFSCIATVLILLL